ncbi:hypothetical protein BOW53_13480 [Solemya pervernicosa gill symbiont]|uniref:Cell division protein ZipA n=2 Tax=Gammaproteobacteria incertae sedis TaxID=118884 RepID=A0A1T2L1M5_9GAMM|nr:cell division protein ZipA C-terminal FtsZ-binding domain-containing protein [Candidatus Reidiella endopervernicosa]OOZ38964.1 hypothetical protein BOW53_13480 [Solemya pervernicosa gill symbiont]QKQ26599.1 cell division protein ZipA C-terminal FtsZ-binding domain-containing protein [Candidatus Reidiella endopervernicosa]
MDQLRLILLIAGVVLIAGIYFVGKQRRRRQADRQPDPLDESVSFEEEFDLPPMSSVEAARDKSIDELGDLDSFSASGEKFEIDEQEPPVLDNPVQAELPSIDTEQRTPEEEEVDADKVVAIYIAAPRGTPFTGTALRPAFEAVGLEYGAMQIFHHRVEGGGVFSLASLVEPGYFEPEKMGDDYATPGLSIFMPLPGRGDAIKTLDTMLESAHTLADRLGGDLLDETKSVLSRQTASHMREEVQDYLLHRKLEQQAANK